MNNITYIQWHIGDFLSDVMPMDSTEIGAYTMLIMVHYKMGTEGIPADEKILMRMTRTNPKVWNRIRDVVLGQFTLMNGRYIHQRVILELKKIREKAGSGRGNTSLTSLSKVDEKNPKLGDEKPVLDSQVENKSLKNNNFQKTNQEPVTNNHISNTNVLDNTPLYISPHGEKSVSVKDDQNSFEEFWVLFPTQRRGSKQKAQLAYIKALKEKRATKEEILNGVQAYRDSDEVARGFAKGAAAWLGDDRWANDYSVTVHSSEPIKQRSGTYYQSQPSYFDKLAAAVRYSQARQMEKERGYGLYSDLVIPTPFGIGEDDSDLLHIPSIEERDPETSLETGDTQTFDRG